jgi:DNA-binding Xre family transcriptional regulator
MVKSKISVDGKCKNRMAIILAERGMSVRDLADVANYHYTTIHRFCSGKQDNVNLIVVAKVCEVLGIQPGDIFGYVPNSSTDYPLIAKDETYVYQRSRQIFRSQ